MTISTNKSAAYDNAVYVGRQLLPLAVSSAGSGGTFGRFICPTALTINGIHGNSVVAGTSTYTVVNTNAGVLSTNTITAATIFNCFRVSGTSTTTYGTAGVVSLAAANPSLYYSLAVGGVSCSAGDIVYCVNGTDATATTIPMWDVSFSPGASVAA